MFSRGQWVQWTYLGVCVEALVGDRVPSGVFTLVDRSARPQLVLAILD